MMFEYAIVFVAVLVFIVVGVTGLHSVVAEAVFSEPPEVGSKNGVLVTTITAAKQESRLGDKELSTMVYNGSLVGPTLRVSPGDRIELTLVNELKEPTNLHFHGLQGKLPSM